MSCLTVAHNNLVNFNYFATIRFSQSTGTKYNLLCLSMRRESKTHKHTHKIAMWPTTRLLIHINHYLSIYSCYILYVVFGSFKGTSICVVRSIKRKASQVIELDWLFGLTSKLHGPMSIQLLDTLPAYWVSLGGRGSCDAWNWFYCCRRNWWIINDDDIVGLAANNDNNEWKKLCQKKNFTWKVNAFLPCF